MSIDVILKRISYINHLIKLKATGNAECLAGKLNLSKSGLEKFIREMQEAGIPIAYSRKIKNYHYTEDEEFYLTLFSGKIILEDIKKSRRG